MTASYRERSLSVRFDAATRLRLLRQERLARRRGATPEAPPSSATSLPVSAGTLRLLAEDPAEVLQDDAPEFDAGDEAEAEPDLAEPDAEIAPPEAGPVEEDILAEAPADDVAPEEATAEVPPAETESDHALVMTGAQADDAEPEGTAVETSAAETGAETGAEPEAGLLEDAVVMAENPAGPRDASAEAPAPGLDGAPETSDLIRLPGIGSGLIWLFGQCGIRSLEDLGRADPEDLAGKLGLVGHLIDLSAFTALARRLHATPAPTPPDESRTDAQPLPDYRPQPLERVD